MKRVLAFAGSNSASSINQKLVTYVSGLLEKHEVNIIQLRDYPAPLFNIDIERNEGFPKAMLELNLMFSAFDALIISLPEYNGAVTPVFKNTVDWISRIEKPVFKDKPILLMSTSPGKRGGQTNLKHVQSLMPWWGGKVISTYSLANFFESMDPDTLTLQSAEEVEKAKTAVREFENKLI